MRRTLSLLAAALITISPAMAVAQEGGWKKLDTPAGQINALTIGSDGTIYTHIGERSYRSTDHGANWTPGGTIDDDVMVFRVGPSGTLYAGTFTSLYRSTDGGESWVHGPWSAGEVWDIAFNSKGHIFIGTENNLVQHSTDNGATWKIRGAQGMGPVWSIAVDADDRVFAGCQGEGFFSSTDDGAHWRWALKNHLIYGIAIGHDGTLFAGTQDSGLYRSTDHGLTFTKTPLVQQSGLAALTVGRTMVIDGAGDLYLFGFGFDGEKGVYPVYRSSDDGDHWERIDQGVVLAAGEYPRALDIDPQGRIMLATSRSIYMLQGSPASVGSEASGTKMLRLEGANPVAGRALFRVDPPARGLATLRIVDPAGGEIALLHDGELGPGSHSIEWDATGAPPGVYLCQLVAGGRMEVVKMVVAR